jgi:hypothetical protein
LLPDALPVLDLLEQERTAMLEEATTDIDPALIAATRDGLEQMKERLDRIVRPTPAPFAEPAEPATDAA